MGESDDFEAGEQPKPLHELSDDQLLEMLRKVIAPREGEFDVEAGLVAFYAAQQSKARLN